MQLVAKHNGVFFRAISTSDDEIELTKLSMLKDKTELEFEVMANDEFEVWLRES